MKKEWNGNKDSVRSRLGINKKHTTKGREKDDFYATNPKALELLLDNCSWFLKNRFLICKQQCGLHYIWEPACGSGNLSELLKQRGYNVDSTDLKDRGYGSAGNDFLQLSCDSHVSIILTNPPYSLATEFIEHALEILPEGGLYIALMNITYLAGQKRYQRVYSKCSLREIYVFSKRIESWKNNDRENESGKSMVDYAWYVFRKGYNSVPMIYWL